MGICGYVPQMLRSFLCLLFCFPRRAVELLYYVVAVLNTKTFADELGMALMGQDENFLLSAT